MKQELFARLTKEVHQLIFSAGALSKIEEIDGFFINELDDSFDVREKTPEHLLVQPEDFLETLEKHASGEMQIGKTFLLENYIMLLVTIYGIFINKHLKK